jgi:uncharacterized protein YcfJ
MNTFKKTSIVVAMAYALSSCASMGDSTRTKAEGTGMGALAGGILGYIVTGGDKKGAAIGAALGAGAGLFVGNEVAKRKQQYATTEDAIAGETQRTEQLTQTVRNENSQLKQDIDIYSKQISSLQSKIRSGKENQSSLSAQKEKVQARYDSAQKSLSTVEKELEVSQQLHQDYQAKGGNSSDLNTWQKKISTLEKEKATLEKNIKTLDTMNSKL